MDWWFRLQRHFIRPNLDAPSAGCHTTPELAEAIVAAVAEATAPPLYAPADATPDSTPT